jgi:acetylornithine aminotransferase
MKLFDVYPLFPITPVRGEGCYVWDEQGTQYLDLYGGHAVISIGHSHPAFLERVSSQLKQLAFYSNSIQNPLQEALARQLGALSGYPDYQLFLCNSGAEANENALKMASFFTGRRKVVAFTGGFHGRTSLAVALTDNPGIVAPVNAHDGVAILPLNDIEAAEQALAAGDVAAVIIEGIQGVGGIQVPQPDFMKQLHALCQQHGTLLIADSVQCGCGRTGQYFAHDWYGIRADMYTMAKGIGNGFPVAAVAIQPGIPAKFGQLGTTFGGSHLACAAALSVVEVMQEENLMDNARTVGNYLIGKLQAFPELVEVRGRGLMIGFDLPYAAKKIREKLLFEHQVFTGSASTPQTIRLLPPLSLTLNQADHFLECLRKALLN